MLKWLQLFFFLWWDAKNWKEIHVCFVSFYQIVKWHSNFVVVVRIYARACKSVLNLFRVFWLCFVLPGRHWVWADYSVSDVNSVAWRRCGFRIYSSIHYSAVPRLLLIAPLCEAELGKMIFVNAYIMNLAFFRYSNYNNLKNFNDDHGIEVWAS